MDIYRFAAILVLLSAFAFMSTSDDGAGIDPFGGRGRTTTSGDHRCTIDPNGSPCTTSGTFSTSQLDPNG
ncbi:MAG TPA: hypothetical protein VEZ11_09075 [Thermoanaerobaculia bacterium]|nr:hypothetical protein [Thermoanaerobaculia bacterium]